MSSTTKIRLALAGIFILALAAAFLDFPKYYNQGVDFISQKFHINLPHFYNLPFHLGLDLQGGTHLIYEADVSQIPDQDRSSSVEGVRDVIERRVNAFGVTEPMIQTVKSGEKWRVIVELAGVKDVNVAIKMIGETPLLEFKKENPNPQIDLTDEQRQELENYNLEAKKKADEVLAKVLAPAADFSALAKEYSEDPGSKDKGGDLDFVKRGVFVPEFEKVCFDDLTLREINKNLVKTQFGYHIIKKEEQRGGPKPDGTDDTEVRCRHILIRTVSALDFGLAPDQWLYTGLTGKQLKKAQVQFDPNTQIPEVALEFNDEGKDLFGEITENNVGKPVAIFLDGQPISVPTVQEPIKNGRAVISGNFTIKEAKTLAQRLNAGALPVPINLISQQTVGASLGKVSVEKSLRAGLWGLLAVVIFMILYYRLPGIFSVITLLIYGFLVLSLFKLIPVTLTLAGIAGFILSLGMAVDANILVFERLKEELKLDKPLGSAIDEAFRRAWPSIRDGNISTLITCLILMWFSTSIVKGFAITLSIGILISMFSAMVITRLLLKVIAKGRMIEKLWLFGVSKKQVTSNE